LRDTLEVVIDRMGFLGDGIARHDNGKDIRELVVPTALPGERWIVAVEGRDRKRLRGRPVRLVERSPGRIDAPCPHFERCGGCALQHIPVSQALGLKVAMIEGALSNRGLAHPPFDPPAVSPEASRRRIRLAVDRNGRVGFRERWSRSLVAIGHCIVAEPALDMLLPALNELAPRLGWLAKGGEIQLTRTDNGVDMHGQSPLRPSVADVERLADTLAPHGLLRISWADGTADIVETLWQVGEPVIRIGEYDLPLPPAAFLQATGDGLRSLQDFAVEVLAGATSLADLFCGLGSLSLPLLDRLDRLTAVDDNRSAIRALQVTVPAVDARVQDLQTRPLSARDLRRLDAAIIDPPRAGAMVQCETIARSTLQRLVYVSCHPASFARDAAILVRHGFRIERLRPIDQFTHAPAIELAAYLVR